jgi:DNA replication and repair protein RecF
LEKLTDHIGSFAAVMIAPDDIGLINEGGEWRRKWMDGILSQLDAAYLQSLLSYQHLQVQRNAWLKQQAQFANADTTVLAYYNQEMHTAAAYIFNKRSEFLSQFMPLLQSYYEQLSASKEQVQLYYKSDLQTQSLLQWLEKELYHDVRLQRTNKGIHKDDLVFSLQGQSLKQFGSQGQKKSFLFALKLAQYHFIRENMQQTPILLLDDVFEKLDNERMEALLGIISGPKFGQVLLTDTDPKRLERAFSEQAAVQYIAL